MSNAYKDFEGLYSAVTNELDLFMTEAERRFEASPADRAWFDAIVAGFSAEFHTWPSSSNAHIRNYLALFDSGSSRVLRLAAHAFLHVAYDLPRVLADHMNHPGTDRVHLRNLFLRPSPRFRQVFLQYLRRPDSGLVLRTLGLVKSLEIFAYWLIALRSVAWIHAEILVDRPDMRLTYEANLAQALHAAGDEARSKLWILGVPRLEVSRLFQVAPAPMILGDGRVSAALALLAVLLGAQWVRHKSLSTRIQTLGQSILLETTKAFAKSRG